MSVIPMKKVRLLVHRDDVDRALTIAQKSGSVEFEEVVLADESIKTTDLTTDSITPTLSRVNQALTFLDTYEDKLGLFAKLRLGTTQDLTEAELETRVPKHDVLSAMLVEIETGQSELQAIVEQLRTLEERKDSLMIWQTLAVPLSAFSTTHTITKLVRIKDVNSKGNQKDQKTFVIKLEEELNKAGINNYIEAVNGDLASVTILKDEKVSVQFADILKTIGGELVLVPTGEGTPAEEVANLEKQIIEANTKKSEIEKGVSELAKKHLSVLRVAHDVFVWESERQEAVKTAKATKRVAVFEGWCNEMEFSNLKNDFAKAQVLCDLSVIEPKKDEEPPVELHNNSVIQPFEIITRLYGLPGHRDLDPTPFLAGFFFLFFGLSLTDVGYGLFLMAVALLVVFYFKVSPIVKLFGKLLFIMGLGSALVGLLFGGYLGIDPKNLPEFLQAIQKFDPIGNPLPVFYLALALGVVQVMFGMMLKIYSDARNGQLITGILDQGPWLLLFVSLIMYGASSTGYITAISTESLLAFVYLALVIVVVASGRTGKTILGKIQMSLLSLYNSIGYFSDILSYSRLLALGLATSALAFAVNLIADIVRDMIPYIGAILAILILIAGHLFTLVVNTLGAFIHSARLQFVEFFGKFITGTGRAFKPLNRKESYITVVKDGS